jgi:L-fuculose-phosphate aldolase
MMSKAGVCRDIVRVTRILADQGLIRSSDGNVSVRWKPDRFLITPSGVYKMEIKPQDILLVDGAGRILSGRPGLAPSSEVRMHLEAYRLRPDVRAVIHAHPPYATAITVAGRPFPMDIVPESLIALGDVPVASYAHPGSPELAASIGPFLPESDSILLSHHGSLNVGRTLNQALIALERVEYTARVYFTAKALGAVRTIPAEKIPELEEIGRRFRANFHP